MLFWFENFFSFGWWKVVLNLHCEYILSVFLSNYFLVQCESFIFLQNCWYSLVLKKVFFLHEKLTTFSVLMAHSVLQWGYFVLSSMFSLCSNFLRVFSHKWSSLPDVQHPVFTQSRGISLFPICVEVGARWCLHKASTPGCNHITYLYS